MTLCDKLNQGTGLSQILNNIGCNVSRKPQKMNYAITFTRKTTRNFDFTTEMWIPCHICFEKEPYVVFYYTAESLMSVITSHNNTGLIKHFEMAKKEYPGHTFIYLIENLAEYYKKKRSLVTRKENHELLEAMGQVKPSKSTKTSKADSDLQNLPDKQMVERQLLYLQLLGKTAVKIHPCSNVESPSWIISFMEQIGIFPDEQYPNVLYFNSLRLVCDQTHH